MTASDAGEPRTAAGKALLAELRRDVHWFIGGSSAKELAFVTAIEDEAAREPLDAAWAEVEAALPEGWRLALARSEDDFDLWEAAAVSAAFFEGENDDEIEEAVGSIPAAALRALAEALRKPVTA